MKVVGIFANLDLYSEDGVNHQTREHIRSMERRGIEWSVILFSPSKVKYAGEIFAKRDTVISSSKSFSFLALKSAWETAIWLLARKKTGILRRIDAEIRHSAPDLLFFDGLPLAPLRLALRNPPAILTCVDAMSLRHYRFFTKAGTIRAKIKHAVRAISCEVLERTLLSRFFIVHVVSEVDANYLRELCPKANICTIPIRAPNLEVTPAIAGARDKFVIWGDVGVPHLRDGLINFLTGVPQLIGPNPPEFLILGRRPPDKELLRLLDLHPTVVFQDWVQNIDLALIQARAVLLLDESGTGLKNRAIHAMALGTIVIGTPSALEGIPIEHGTNAFMCRDAADFAAVIGGICVATNEDIARLGRNAARFVKERYADNVISDKWEALFRKAVGNSPYL